MNFISNQPNLIDNKGFEEFKEKFSDSYRDKG
jgi:hypothetical protein